MCYEAFANIVEFIQYATRLPRDTAVLNRNVFVSEFVPAAVWEGKHDL